MSTVVLICEFCGGEGCTYTGPAALRCKACFGRGTVDCQLTDEHVGADVVFVLRAVASPAEELVVAEHCAAHGTTFWDLYPVDRDGLAGKLPEGPSRDTDWAAMTADEYLVSGAWKAVA